MNKRAIGVIKTLKQGGHGVFALKFFVLVFICFVTCGVYAQMSSSNSPKQLEDIERTFADLASRNAYVEDLSLNEESPIHL